MTEFDLPEATKARVAELIRRQKTGLLSSEETAELNACLRVEHLMRLTKARARQRLGTQVNVISFSEAGGHAANEDAFAAQRHPADPDCWLCCLADGQGGHAGAAQAARLACRTAIEAAAQQPPWKLAAHSTWASLLRRADEAVSADPAAGLTTLIGFSLATDALAGASSGDSGVLVLSSGQPPREVTAGQAKNPPVGSGAADFVPFAASLVSPWTVLAVSDGVWKYVGWDRIVEAASVMHGQELVQALQGHARLRNGRFQDDFTGVLFEGIDAAREP